MTTPHTRGLRIDALLEMWEQDGQSPAGSPPPVEYISALRDAEQMVDVDAVAEAHKQGNAPPEVPLK